VSDSLRDAWEAQAENWAAWARTPGHDHFFWRVNLPPFLGLLPPPGRLTLDLGGGEGRLGRMLQERGHRVVSVDASPTLARLTATHEHAQPVALSDMAALPFGDECADLAIAFMSLQDVDDLGGAVREAARVLVSGGSLCIAIVHPLNSAGAFEGKEADSSFVIRGSYLDEFRYSDEIERDGLPMTFNSEHRPMETYSHALEDAGFVIVAIREPRDPGGTGKDLRWRRIPPFLHIRAVRR
jgi:ubiquinone/menaquinone biosynthesis C-methylase UbiE